MRRLLPFLMGLLLFSAECPGGPAYTHYVKGDPARPAPGRTQAALLLMGGGDEVDASFHWFVRMAGGGRVLVLRASGEDDYQEYLYDRIGGMVSVETLVFHSREASSDKAVLEILRRADGIFIAGGDQGNYVRYWKGTPVAEILNAHVASGRPLGGTSAGLAIMGAHSYGCLDGHSLRSSEALLDPFGPSVTLVDDFLDLPFMRGVITDSHFEARSRLGRLVTFVARLSSGSAGPVKGLGIDERTVLCVEPDGTARLFTRDQGRAWLVFPSVMQIPPLKGEPLVVQKFRVVVLGPDSHFNLRTFDYERPEKQLLVSSGAGALVVENHHD